MGSFTPLLCAAQAFAAHIQSMDKITMDSTGIWRIRLAPEPGHEMAYTAFVNLYLDGPNPMASLEHIQPLLPIVGFEPIIVGEPLRLKVLFREREIYTDAGVVTQIELSPC